MGWPLFPTVFWRNARRSPPSRCRFLLKPEQDQGPARCSNPRAPLCFRALILTREFESGFLSLLGICNAGMSISELFGDAGINGAARAEGRREGAERGAAAQ